MDTAYHMLINGEITTSKQTFPVINPATLTIIAEAPIATAEQINTAVDSAHDAFATWSSSQKIDFRKSTLLACQKALEHHIDEIGELLTLEQGKPLKAAKSEVTSSLAKIPNILNYDFFSKTLEENEKGKVEMQLIPFGVVTAITPWNYPVYIAISKIVAALWVGNTIVLKPSEYTPLTTLKIGEILKDVLPKGVLNIVSGSGEVGALLVKHPKVRMVSFTGSVPTGKAIAAMCADDLKRVTLELGGNDAAILLEDAPIDKIAEKIFWGAFTNSGQICTAIKRVYVHQSQLEQLAEILNKIAADTIVGDGTDPTTQMGPLNNKMQYDKVLNYYKAAKESGAKIWGGGPVDGPGYFFKPTIVTNLEQGHPLIEEEQFGPILPLISYDDINKAIDKANALNVGLAGSVWSQDENKAYDVAQQMHSGTIWVNTVHDAHQDACFGGVKQSGIGREGGIEGLKSFGEFKMIYKRKIA